MLGLVKRAFTALVTLLTIISAEAAPIYMSGADGSSLYTVNSTNGSSTLIGSYGLSSLYTQSFSSDGTLYGIANGYGNGTLVKINTTTGAANSVGFASGIENLMSMAFASDGTLYVGSWATNNLYKMDVNTGLTTLIGALGFGGIMDLDFDSTGKLYALSDNLYTVNTSTGAGTLKSTLSNGCLMGMAIDTSNNFFATDYCTSNTPLYSMNTNTGALTSLGNTGIEKAMGGAFAPAANAVPEPGAIILVALGLLGIALCRKRVTA